MFGILSFLILLPQLSSAQGCGENALCIDYSSPCSGQEIANSCEAGMKCCQYKNLTVPDSPGSSSSGGGIPTSTQQGTPTGGSQSSSSGFGNPITPTTIEGVLSSIMSYLRGIAGTIAVIFIIIGGVMYMLSGGSKEMTERAKKTVIFAMVGLAIVLAAPLFYQEIKAVLSGNNPGSALQQLLLNILRLLLSIIGFIAIISMVVGAMWMFTAVGDEDKYELGKKTATYSILGLVIAVAALILAQEVVNLVGGGTTATSPSSTDARYGAGKYGPSGYGTENEGHIPDLPSSEKTSGGDVNAMNVVGITEGNMYAYKGSDGNYYEMDPQKGMIKIDKNDVNPITQLGTLERTGNTIFRDHSGYYYEMASGGPVPLQLKEGDAVNYFPSKK